MPRVTFVKAARKDNPVAKKGESYYWWKFRYGGKRYSLTRPKPSQLTQSAYFGTIYGLQEQIEATNCADWDECEALMEEIKSEIDSLRDETQGSLDNMPESLQYSPTGELLQERIDALENAESEFDSIDEWDEEEPQPSDFTQDCDDCEGTGEVEGDGEADGDGVDEDGDPLMVTCTNCDGNGNVDDESEYDQEFSDWEQRRDEAISTAKEAMTDALDNCIC